MSLKVLSCNPDGGAFKYILDGVGRAFTASGAAFQAVQGANVPQHFDLYLGCSGWRQNIPSNRTGLVGIHVNPYGPKKVGSVDGGPTIEEPKHIIKWTLAQKPDFVYCYCSEAYVMDYYGHYLTKHGIPIVCMPTAADILVYKPHPPVAKYRADIGWVGGYWGYKAKMLDKYMKPLIAKYNCLVYGWGGWKDNKKIHDNDVPALFSSCKICPSVSESHTREHPIDVPERLFKVPAAGGFTIHTPSPALPDLFGEEMPVAKNPKHWLELVEYYLKNPEERVELAKRQRRTVLKRHTYFDRIFKMANQASKKDAPKWEPFKESIIQAKSKAINGK